jgi:NAD(P)-dependent dehydrogenase (short-subunit alcohol dehydrogenase family)
MLLRGNVALVTGAASGLGAACARLFGEAGASVLVVDRDEKNGAALAAAIGERALFCAADVASGADLERAVEAARQRWGGLHVAVHCAGIVHAARVLGKSGPADLEAFRRVIEVNLIGTFNVARVAAAVMAANPPAEDGERGVIITTASVAAFDGQIGQAAYAASKGGVAAMTLPLARDLARHGIRVVSIAPGVFETPMMASLPENVRASLAALVPFPSRLGKPEEFAALARHVIENRMLNGEVIRLDGALRMPPS